MDPAEEIKNSGLKATGPRMKILGLFQNATQRHMSAEDVYRTLLQQGLDVGMATIYRVLAQFEQAGLQVLPAPMGFKGGQARKLYRVLPRASALSDSSLALHEWLGILAQRASLDR